MIRAAFFDVDGTLLSHYTGSVPQSARTAVQKLQAAGIRCIVATGRQLGEMEKLPVGDIPFDGYITLNGQLLLNRDKQVLAGTPITGKAKDTLLRMFEERKLPLLIVEQERIYLNLVDERVISAQKAISSEVPPVGTYGGEEIYQVCAYLSDGEEGVLAELTEQCVITRWNSSGVDIIAKGGGKVAGIQRYLQEEGILPGEIIAFGDGENDLEMLRFAGIGVAMGNACDSVKAAADYVTADIDEDGVEKGLRHFGLME